MKTSFSARPVQLPPNCRRAAHSWQNPDYDQVLPQRPTGQPPAFFTDGGRRHIVHQVWDWIDDRTYMFPSISLKRRTPAGNTTTTCHWPAVRPPTLAREHLNSVIPSLPFTPPCGVAF